MKKFGKKELLDEIDFYLFGSSSFTNIVNDIDILIIFNNDAISPITVINLKKEIYLEIMRNLKVRSDFLTFSLEEARDYKIIKRIKGKRINIS
ncbi:MAG: hypothetical protein QM793_08400 [Muricomes sp.]